MTPGGNVRFSYFCRSHIDHFCKIILISDNWFQMRFLKVFLCHDKPPPLVAMFLMDQIRLAIFVDGQGVTISAISFFIQTIDFREDV